MTSFERPANEEARLRALWDAEILDTEPEQRFDDLTRLASAICQAPIALVSLIDADRQWFKARVGLTATETPRGESICTHAILGDDVFIVRDTILDARFVGLPSVTSDPYVRFYAGAPIRMEGGLNAGTVCVIDRVPRELTADQIESLRCLARMAGTNLDLRRVARALARANEQLADLLDSTHDLIQSVAPDGRLLFTNRAWKAAMGYSDRELASLRITEIVAPESQAAWASTMSRALAGEHVSDLAATLLGRDGRRVHVEGAASCKMEGGRAAWARTVLRDVTGRIVAERERHELITAAAEEMRAPLTAIRGALDLLSDPAAAVAAPELCELAASKTDALLQQVQHVVDLERLETGVYELAPGMLRAADLMRAAETDVRRLAAERAVAVRVEVALDLVVRGDRDAVQQVFYNLLANAVRRSPAGRAVNVRAARAQNGVRFSFEDEGDALAADERRIAFEVVSRRPAGAPRGDSATSMAMAVTKAIVQAHKGVVGVSDKARGGAFWIELPA